MSANPREIIDDGNMHFMQWVAIALMIMLNALDGFDVLSSAFAGPGIKAEWGLGPDGLGAVLSMELVGMGFGSLLLGGAADKYGRRPTILFCLTLMASGMFLATTADSPQALSAWRFLTGLGIGGMLASINAVTAELSSKKSRSVAMALMVIGYPLGAFFGGLVASDLLQTRDWRSVFMFGGIMTAIMIPMVLLFVPETPAFLNQKRPENALSRINKILARYGHQTIDALPALAPGAVKARIMDLFSPAMIRTTFILAVGYSFHALTFYYILKLAPSIISDPQFAGQSFTRSEGASVLAYANLGGALGGAAFGWFMHKFGVKRSTQVALAFSAVFVAAFGFGHSSLLGWTLGVIAVGLFTNAAIVGFYTAFAASYPTQLRATGTGFALSVGRGGAALSPYLAGVLFGAGLGLLKVSLIMAMGSLIALLLFSMLKLNNPEDEKT
ncbi:MFS transporter [Parasphingorhabdus sp.]|uniref:MFS transporter n=1 Tax=Parasphingorhabdus sp. TaxID=2709688 RepID=UPI0030030491